MCVHDTGRRLPGNGGFQGNVVALHKNAYIRVSGFACEVVR